jgi:hypothetical protein
MYQAINVYQFREEFKAIRPNNFTYEGLTLLHDYLEQYEEETGEELEIDVIALCCDFSEDTTENIAQSYDIEQGDYTSLEEAVAEYLQDQGAFIGGTTNGSIVYRNDF